MRRCQILAAASLVLFIWRPAWAQEMVLLEAPISLEGSAGSVWMMAYFDGERFWVDPGELLVHLGFEVTFDEFSLSGVDQYRAFVFDFGTGDVTLNGDIVPDGRMLLSPQEGRYLTSMETMEAVFEGDLTWDPTALKLTTSSAATRFDPTPFMGRRDLFSEATAPLVFGRDRRWLGGAQLNYSLRNSYSPTYGSHVLAGTGYSAAVLQGTARGYLSRSNQTASWTLDVRKPWLTRISVGHTSSPSLVQVSNGMAVRASNYPLASLRVHRTRTLTGIAPPYALVYAGVSGQVSDRVQADGEGRYRLTIPVYYGSTQAFVRIAPLGEEGSATTEKLNYLTPDRLLPTGMVYYDVLGSRDMGALVMEYGLRPRMSVRTGFSYGYLGHIMAGFTLLPRRTMYVDGESNLTERTGQLNMVWWQTWGRMHASYYSARRPLLYQRAAAGWAATFGPLNLRGQSSVVAYDGTPSRVTAWPEISWRTQRNLPDVSLGAQWRWIEGDRMPPRINTAFIQRLRVRGGTFLIHTDMFFSSRELTQYLTRLSWNHRKWNVSAGATGRLDTNYRSWYLRFQLNTNAIWANAAVENRGGTMVFSQSTRGTMYVDRTVTFASQPQETSQAILTVFVDEDFDGVRDSDEEVTDGVALRVASLPTYRRDDGALRVVNLVPNATYPVEIVAETLPDAALYPEPGYRFGFVAEPGRTKRIDIPLQPLPIILGSITGWPHSTQVLEVVFVGPDGEVRVPVYQDGGFLTQLIPGTYTVRVVNSIDGAQLLETERYITTDPDQIVLDVSTVE